MGLSYMPWCMLLECGVGYVIYWYRWIGGNHRSCGVNDYPGQRRVLYHCLLCLTSNGWWFVYITWMVPSCVIETALLKESNILYVNLLELPSSRCVCNVDLSCVCVICLTVTVTIRGVDPFHNIYSSLSNRLCKLNITASVMFSYATLPHTVSDWRSNICIASLFSYVLLGQLSAFV